MVKAYQPPENVPRYVIQENIFYVEKQRLLQARREQETKARKQAITQTRIQEKMAGLEAPSGMTEYKKWVIAQRTQTASEQFYKDIGFEQYAGKYQPFTIPEGYKVQTITEIAGSLEVTFKPLIQESKGIAETMMKPEPYPMKIGQPLYSTIMKQFSAGTIASGESFVYSLARFGGLKTPAIPSTFLGGLFSSVKLESRPSVISDKDQIVWSVEPSPELKQVQSYGAIYAAGSLFGDYLIGKGLSKTVQKLVVQPLKDVWKTSKAESWVIRHSESYRKKAAESLSKGVVSYPTGGKLTDIGYRQAQNIAWELGLTPRTGLVSVEKVGKTMSPVWRVFSGATITPMSVTLAKAIKQDLLSSPQQIGVQVEKPAVKHLPYLPSFMPAITKGFPSLIGFPFVFGAHVIPRTTVKVEPVKVKPVEPVYAPEKLKPRVVFHPFDFQIPRTHERQTPFIFPRVTPRIIPRQKVKPVQEQKQIEVPKLITIQETVTPLKTVRIPEFFYEPSRKKRRKKTKAKSLWSWGKYPREYPLMTSKTLYETLF